MTASKKCAYSACSILHYRKGLYCSDRCKDKAWREANPDKAHASDQRNNAKRAVRVSEGRKATTPRVKRRSNWRDNILACRDSDTHEYRCQSEEVGQIKLL
jgi:hypothetical protein